FGFVFIVCLRWIWIAGYGDYGNTYEAAYRVMHGEVPYRDFIFTNPPVTNYTLAFLLTEFGNSLWLYHIHLFIWWIASLIVGLVLLDKFNADRTTKIAAIILAGTMSLPLCTNWMPYSYLAPAVSGIVLIFLYQFH